MCTETFDTFDNVALYTVFMSGDIEDVKYLNKGYDAIQY